MIPNVESPDKTFFHYYTQSWNSYSNGRYVSTISPQTWGEKDIISETRYRLLQHGTEEEKEKAETLIRRESWLANVYVVNDPENPENSLWTFYHFWQTPVSISTESFLNDVRFCSLINILLPNPWGRLDALHSQHSSSYFGRSRNRW